MDDFKLPSTEWDVLVAGTGVKQSLLAAALSRAGKKVLQTDPNPYYGSSEAAFSLDELEHWTQNLPADSPFSAASVERRATITRPRAYTLTLAPHLVYWGCNLLELLRNVEMTSSFTWQAVGSWWVYLTDEAVAERPVGGGVGGALIEAGVKAMKVGGTIRKKGGWNKNRKSRDLSNIGAPPEVEKMGLPELSRDASSTTSTLRKLGGVLREVPCTFEDVAWSEDLQDRDRGYLGGFLRFVMKCSDPSDTKHHQLYLDHVDTPFSEFLTTVYPLPPFTIASLHSLTLLPTAPHLTPLRTALTALTTHLTSLGGIPDIRSSAALTIAYGGSAELCQVWSRGAAVAGGLNVLERGITTLTPPSITLSNNETITATWTITSPPPPLASSPPCTALTKGIFVVSAPLTSLFERKAQEDRIAPNAAVLTFPVAALGANRSPVYVIAHSAATGECLAGEAVLYVSTLQAHPEDYAFLEAAVERVLAACSDDGRITFVCRYTQAFSSGGGSVREKDGDGDSNDDDGRAQALALTPMSGELAFDAGVVDECRHVYERIMGTGDGFLEMTEEMRRQQQEEEG